MKTKILIFLCTSLCYLSNSQRPNDIDSLIGSFSLQLSKEVILENAFEILKEDEIYYYKNIEKNNEKLIELSIIDVSKINGKYYDNLPKSALVLGDEKHFVIIKIPIGWQLDDFTSSTGYFILSMVGPIEVLKN